MSDTKELIERLNASADEVASFPHPSHCEHLHDASAVMRQAADTIARLTAERDAARREAMEECAQMLEAQHALRSHLDNHAACYARAIREAMDKP